MDAQEWQEQQQRQTPNQQLATWQENLQLQVNMVDQLQQQRSAWSANARRMHQDIADLQEQVQRQQNITDASQRRVHEMQRIIQEQQRIIQEQQRLIQEQQRLVQNQQQAAQSLQQQQTSGVAAMVQQQPLPLPRWL